ncbi:cytochrome c oxidase subunit II [Candidatus Palauibacter soopunensis]|uniref:cytochrome c oxidase subunit II n=1 Tax=Candidatus Palauibacter soopunensis TaxID=3056739 RepID=UPI002386AD51|nr:cytochrome c oxidase subunit II [Candidatus Palauibacter soopunensis]MDE2879752.1 cytochrome c oxidase subunit II [Candidatus Palauibacter soopunensis]
MRRRAIAALVLFLGVLISQGCGGEYPQSALHPSSDSATLLDQLFDQIFWWAVGVFVVVEGILIYVFVRFRERPGDGRPKQVHGHLLLEVGWTLLPALILVAIAIPTMRAIFIIDRSTPDPEALVIEVIGKQWWWEFRYPELGIVTANEAHVPLGRTVDLRLRSADVMHSFWVPRLAGKRDLVPGIENQLWFRPDSVGVYHGQCAEFCGTAHALMGMRLIVDEPEDFDRWARANAAPASTPAAAEARAGQGVFMANACVSCHAVRGTPAAGQFGPDLTHFGSRLTIASGVLENTPANLARWLDSTQHVKPGNPMPEVELSDAQLRQLVAYLGSLR